MGTFLLTLEDELHNKAKIKAIQQNKTLHEFIVQAVANAVSPQSVRVGK